MSDQLIVAGFHRSGTSLVCRLLDRAGLFLGYELVGANPSNPYGHFEDVEVLELHRQIMTDNGLSWQVEAPFLPVLTEEHWRGMRRVIECRDEEHGLWGFKDPRVCLFLMVWKHLLPNAKVLVVYRHFSDATYSLSKRHSRELFREKGPVHLHRRFWEEPDLGLRMWLAHNEALLAFARVYPEDVLAVSFEMVWGGFPLVGAVNRRWGLGLEEVAASEVFDPAATGERRGRQPVSDEGLIWRVEATWRELERLGERTKRMMGGRAVVEGGLLQTDGPGRLEDGERASGLRPERLSSVNKTATIPLPTFLIIGAQKSGTRWLRTNLGAHPQVFTANTELSFFNGERFHQGLDWYRANFEGWDGEPIVGEATPAYMMWRGSPARTATRIDESLAGVKLLALLRNPVDRTYSAFIHHMWRGRIPADADLLEWVRSVAPEHERFSLIAGGWYAASLTPYFERFGERMQVFLHDDALADPKHLYSRALEHIGASPGFIPPELERVLFSRKPPEPSAYHKDKGGRRELRFAERAKLYEYFRRDIDSLEELLGQDLSIWRPY